MRKELQGGRRQGNHKSCQQQTSPGEHSDDGQLSRDDGKNGDATQALLMCWSLQSRGSRMCQEDKSSCQVFVYIPTQVEAKKEVKEKLNEKTFGCDLRDTLGSLVYIFRTVFQWEDSILFQWKNAREGFFFSSLPQLMTGWRCRSHWKSAFLTETESVRNTVLRNCIFLSCSSSIFLREVKHQ